ncbi:hypothetical protein HJC23_010413 [Cyclotella cryptica]|uniref:J domain-containing protein n=1 Tax=Cyclotella cryptica TaxID=29204 RepID=A0ABD3QH36_9STRA|eukprot:CCRYP_005273-RA/>CCRYP_005273-RA protein AED:0.11 eAED:0.11 QI:116/-1/1/1/-1/1/1/363/330
MAKREGSFTMNPPESTSSNKRQHPSRTSSNNRSHPVREPNFDSTNPYEILGVPPDATAQQIKISYRKLALQHHPDKLSPQASEAEKQTAHKNFTAIGHAYEILGDEARRGEYDSQQRNERRGHRFDDMFSDPFFSSFGGMRNGSRSSRNRPTDFHFMDPFELFNQFFSDEMDHMSGQRRNSSRSRHVDPVESFFGSDPFFSSGFGGASHMMSRHFDMMNSMSSMMSQMDGGSMFGGFESPMISNGGHGASYHFSSSSSSGRGGSRSVSTSTRTTIVNGVRTTVTERTVVHPDGRVERHVESTGGENPALPSSSGNRPAIGYDDGRGRRRR